MADFSLTKYIQALERLSGSELRAAVHFLYVHIVKAARLEKSFAALKRKIDEAAKNPVPVENKPHRYPLLGKSTFNNYLYVDRQGPKRQKPLLIDFDNQEVKDNIRGYLLFFQEKYSVALACEEGPGNAWQVVRASTGEFVVRDTNQRQAVVYDVFYPRTYTKSKETQIHEIGVAKLRFDANGEDVELVFHYLTKKLAHAHLAGKVHKKRNNYYLELKDTKTPEDQPEPIRYYVSLYVADEVERREYLSGVYATSDRSKDAPVCGMIHLVRSSNPDLHRSQFIRDAGHPELFSYEGIPEAIYYSLFNVRFRVPPDKILRPGQFLYAGEAETLSTYAGTYQVYAPRSENRLKLMRLELSARGVATLSEKEGDDIIGYVDYCTNKLLLIKFDYKEANYYRFHYFLEPEPSTNRLKGIFAGLTGKSQLTASRVYLRREDANHPKVLEDYNPLPEDVFNDIRQNDEPLYQFLTDRAALKTDARWARFLGNLPAQPASTEPPTPPAKLPLEGTYNAFYLTKSEQRNRRGNSQHFFLPDQPIQLVRLPIAVESGNVVAWYSSTKTVPGTVHSFDGNHRWAIRFDSPLDASLTLSLPTSAEKSVFHYGLFTQFHNGKEPEASALILYRETELSELTYQHFTELADFQALDKRYEGMASFLHGDWGRFIRMPSYEMAKGRVLDKFEDFRSVFFAAACHHSRRGEGELCRKNLWRAYRHGFAMDSFAGLTPQRNGFPEALLRERTLLREAVKGDLASEKELVGKLWGPDVLT